jgi:Tfp pilus assembly protein PilN
VKSQINLLHKEFIPRFEWVCSSHFVGLIIGTVVLCLGAYGITSYYHVQKQQQVTQIKNQIKLQQSSIAELTSALTSRVVNPQLQSKLTSFTEETRSRNLLLNQIRNLSALKQRSFSVLFDSLSQATSSQLWLTNFLVTPEQLHLQGKLSTPQALPTWINELSKTPFFTGQEFNLASVERNDRDLVFELKSVSKEQVSNLAHAGVGDER